jgi:hypothetical protein
MRVGFLVWFLATLGLVGCAINRESASASSDIELSHLKKFYVLKFAPDERGINNLIATELDKLGFEASTGLESSAPKDVDAIVTYRDKWQWDITMYMIELRVFIREPQTDNLLAVGNSLHTSLTRKSPEEMVAEVLLNIFRTAKGPPQSKK